MMSLLDVATGTIVLMIPFVIMAAVLGFYLGRQKRK